MTKNKKLIYGSSIVIILIATVVIGFLFDWSLKPITLNARDFRDKTVEIYFNAHKNYSGNLEVFRDGKLAPIENIRLGILNTYALKGENRITQEGNPLNIYGRYVYKLTFDVEEEIEHGDAYELKIDNKPILKIILDPPLIEVKNIEITDSGLRIVFHNNGGWGNIWTESPRVIPINLEDNDYVYPSCSNVKRFTGRDIKEDDEFVEIYDCKNMVPVSAINKITVCIGFSTRVERECKTIDFLEMSELEISKEEIKDEISNWKIYRDKEYGFEIKYPRDWELYEKEYSEEVKRDMNLVGSVEFTPKGEVYSIEESKIYPVSILIYNKSLQQYLKEISEEKKKNTLISGVPATEIEGSLGETRILAIERADKDGYINIVNYVYGITMAGSISSEKGSELHTIFNQMFSSFRFLE